MTRNVKQVISNYNTRNLKTDNCYDFSYSELYAIMEISCKPKTDHVDLWTLVNNALSYGFEIGYTTAEKELSENR